MPAAGNSVENRSGFFEASSPGQELCQIDHRNCPRPVERSVDHHVRAVMQSGFCCDITSLRGSKHAKVVVDLRCSGDILGAHGHEGALDEPFCRLDVSELNGS